MMMVYGLWIQKVKEKQIEFKQLNLTHSVLSYISHNIEALVGDADIYIIITDKLQAQNPV